ncbi:MAG: DUF1552 domain-containing protein [Sandaracinus sp.]|nr:DUF1552 domain-containing protein [Sandaracinus sp.]
MKPSKRSFRGAIGRRGFVRTLMGVRGGLALCELVATRPRTRGRRRCATSARLLLPRTESRAAAKTATRRSGEARASGGRITLSEQLEPLAGFEDRCVFLNGLQMGSADEGSHPGGAKKLLTNVDGGNGMSLDQFLASSVGRGAPFPHLYLGAQATVNGASGDKFISYPTAGTPTPPEDDPRRAFSRLFDGTVVAPDAGLADDGSRGRARARTATQRARRAPRGARGSAHAPRWGRASQARRTPRVASFGGAQPRPHRDAAGAAADELELRRPAARVRRLGRDTLRRRRSSAASSTRRWT